MRELVTELRVVGPDENMFDTDIEYTIPLYQRAYAWEDKQLIQLIEDISDVADDANYYIGALIVSRQGNKTLLTFKGGDNNIKGSRPLHLREKIFEVAESDEEGNLKVDMSKIFLDKQ